MIYSQLCFRFTKKFAYPFIAYLVKESRGWNLKATIKWQEMLQLYTKLNTLLTLLSLRNEV